MLAAEVDFTAKTCLDLLTQIRPTTSCNKKGMMNDHKFFIIYGSITFPHFIRRLTHNIKDVNRREIVKRELIEYTTAL